MKNLGNLRFGILSGMILLAAISRFLPVAMPSLSNFSPVGAMALFGGAYFAKKSWAFAVPLFALWVSNLVLNNFFYKQYYPSFSFGFETTVFISIAFVVLVGIVLLKKVTITNLLLANLVGTVGFFLISNFFVWNSGQMYPLTTEGLVACYTMALPFLKNSLLSNLLFSGVMFGMFEYAKTQVKELAVVRA
ncbi:MAG: DUF6580 family putative transport protein [Bacteroidota bacterium]|jgi:hypothetical protein